MNNTQQFSDEYVITIQNNTPITIKMAKDIVRLYLACDELKNPQSTQHKLARTCLERFLDKLENKPNSKPTKEEFKAVVEVIKEIRIKNARNIIEIQQAINYEDFCKKVIELFYQ